MTFTDLLDEVQPDSAAEFPVIAQEVVPFELNKNQRISYTGDGKPKVSSSSSRSSIVVTLNFKNITEVEGQAILAHFHDPAGANGMARTFPWTNYGENPYQLYTARYASPKLPGSFFPWGQHQFSSLNIILEGTEPGGTSPSGVIREDKATATRKTADTTTRQIHKV